MKRVHIHGGHLVDPANGIDAPQDLFIAEGRVVAVGEAPAGFAADHRIDARGLTVVPGLVDLQARLREPGQEHKATIASECAAAAAGGITTLCVPPDTEPVIDTPAVVELIHQRAETTARARIVPLGALTRGLEGQQLSEMAELQRVGCVGMSNARRPVSNTLVLRRALEYAASHDITVFLQPCDAHLASEGCAHEGSISARLGLPGIPASAETVAVAQILMLIEQTGTRVHFGQLSTARAASMIARARYDGLPISADVAAHHLHLTDMDIGYFNSNCHVEPPLRSARRPSRSRALRWRAARWTPSAPITSPTTPTPSWRPSVTPNPASARWRPSCRWPCAWSPTACSPCRISSPASPASRRTSSVSTPAASAWATAPTCASSMRATTGA